MLLTLKRDVLLTLKGLCNFRGDSVLMFPSYRYIELFLEHLLEVTRYGCVFRNELVFPSKAREKHFLRQNICVVVLHV